MRIIRTATTAVLLALVATGCASNDGNVKSDPTATAIDSATNAAPTSTPAAQPTDVKIPSGSKTNGQAEHDAFGALADGNLVAGEVEMFLQQALANDALMSNKIDLIPHVKKNLKGWLSGDAFAYLTASPANAQELGADTWNGAHIRPREVVTGGDSQWAKVDLLSEVSARVIDWKGSQALEARVKVRHTIFADQRASEADAWAPVTYAALRDYLLVLIPNTVGDDTANAWRVDDWKITKAIDAPYELVEE